MFRYAIKGKTNDRPYPVIIALTDYADIASYIKDHAIEALDPSGEEGLSITIAESSSPRKFIKSSMEETDIEKENTDYGYSISTPAYSGTAT